MCGVWLSVDWGRSNRSGAGTPGKKEPQRAPFDYAQDWLRTQRKAKYSTVDSERHGLNFYAIIQSTVEWITPHHEKICHPARSETEMRGLLLEFTALIFRRRCWYWNKFSI